MSKVKNLQQGGCAMKSTWRNVTLGDIFEITSSKRVFQNQWRTSGVPFYRAREIAKLALNGTVQNELFISEELFQELSKKYDAPKPGDLMISAVGTLGACYVVQPDDRFYFKDASVLQFRPKNSVCPRFIQHAFRTKQILDQVNSGSGTTVGTFTISRAKETHLVLPPFAEQKRIAAILDKADAIRRKLQQSLRLSDDLLRSVFLDMFGDPVTNPKGWPVHTLTSVIGDSFRNGLSPSTSGTVAGKVLTLSAVTSGTFAPQFLRDAIFDRTPSENQQVTRNTFLICRGNGNKSMVGIGVFPEADMPSVSFPDTMIACTIDRTQIEPEYLQAVWSTAKVRKQIDAGARTTNGTYKVNQTLLGGIEFPLPPLAIQKKFSGITQATRSQSVKTAKLAAESEALFSSLQQRAFRGEL